LKSGEFTGGDTFAETVLVEGEDERKGRERGEGGHGKVSSNDLGWMESSERKASNTPRGFFFGEERTFVYFSLIVDHSLSACTVEEAKVEDGKGGGRVEVEARAGW